LHYYGARGRAQQIRWALAEAGIDWNDAICAFPPPAETKAMWTKLGGNTTTNVPMLEMDGSVYTQSQAVLKAVARQGGLYPTDPKQAYQVDNILCAVDDLRSAGYKVVFNAAEAANFRDVTLPLHASNFERLLGDSDFFVGDQCTVADLGAYDAFTGFAFNLIPSLKDSYPKLQAFVARIEARPRIAAYLASEKCTKLVTFDSKE